MFDGLASKRTVESFDGSAKQVVSVPSTMSICLGEMAQHRLRTTLHSRPSSINRAVMVRRMHHSSDGFNAQIAPVTSKQRGWRPNLYRCLRRRIGKSPCIHSCGLRHESLSCGESVGEEFLAMR